MTKEVDYESGTIVSSDWLDAVQEINSGHSVNFRLEKSGDTVRVVAGAGKDQVSIVVNGLMRYTTTTKATAAISGAAATHNIFATADSGDREFALVATTAATPAGVTNYRKVGEAVWDGTAITEVRSMASSAPTHNPTLTGTVTVPTPASASDTAVPATTEWVRDFAVSDVGRLGSLNTWALQQTFSGLIVANGGVKHGVTASAATTNNLSALTGDIFRYTGASNGEATLPAAASYRGRRIFIYNDSDFELLVHRAGTDTMNGSSVDVTLYAQEGLIVASPDSGSDWMVLRVGGRNAPLDSVTSTALKSGSVTSGAIAASAVTPAKINVDSYTSMVRKTANQSLAHGSGSYTDVSFATSTDPWTDALGAFTGPYFTIPTTGWYAAGANLEFEAIAQTGHIAVLIQHQNSIGVAINNIGLHIANNLGNSFLQEIPCPARPFEAAAGDRVVVRAFQTNAISAARNINAGENTFFWLQRVGV